MFLVAMVWALSPKNRKDFDEAAGIPFREQDDGDAAPQTTSGLQPGTGER
jgi:cbb3-type cytochrome oxidase subunit 3